LELEEGVRRLLNSVADWWWELGVGWFWQCIGEGKGFSQFSSIGNRFKPITTNYVKKLNILNNFKIFNKI